MFMAVITIDPNYAAEKHENRCLGNTTDRNTDVAHRIHDTSLVFRINP